MAAREPFLYPDFVLCHPVYGTGLSVDACYGAHDQFPDGLASTEYYHLGHEPYCLPFSRSSRGCRVSLDVAGFPVAPVGTAIPNTLKSLAATLIQSCVADHEGLGGFGTIGLNRLLQWSLNPASNIFVPAPMDATFFTLTVSSGLQGFSPGDFDPAIAVAMSDADQIKSLQAPPESTLRSLHEINSRYWQFQAECMQRGGTMDPWWKHSSSRNDEMTYECDANLGRPSGIDCTQIEWYQVSPANRADMVTIGPETKFLHSNTCYLALSAAVAIVVSWDQIYTALATLLNICVQHPVEASRGGRAYFGPQPRQRSGGRGKRHTQVDKVRREVNDRRRGVPSGLSGLNAIPPHLNLTVFQQTEPWTNPVGELNTCTWKAITKGLPVTRCVTT